MKEVLNDFSHINDQANRRNMNSNEKTSGYNNMVSPFEKRIANYQKSAEMRKN